MSAELIAKKYAKVLIDIENAKSLNDDLKILKALSDALENREVAEVVNSPLRHNSKKFELFIEPLKSKMGKNLYNLLKLMAQKGRLNLIPNLFDILSLELKKESNRYEGVVEADKRLSGADIRKLQNILYKHSGATIELKQISSNSDGLKVRVDELGLELNYSKGRLKRDLLDFIQRAL